MQIPGLSNQYRESFNSSHPKNCACSNDFMGVMSAASKQIDKQEYGDVLGLTMINEPGTDIFWGAKAKYASCSTDEDPVIYVETNYGGKTVAYNVNINEVDPSNASYLEMFALCSYADDIGIGDNSTFGTYSTLRSFENMAKHNGYFEAQTDDISGLEQFKNEKLNWISMSKSVVDLLYKCKDFIQYRKGLDILDMFNR